ncbi:MAG TPA: cation:dicarboxylase symporter family transporter [Sphingorhabdus sp.]|jgi:Na+/H+-dicarboxylate symporter|uniref:dicarboxylate/amino acid:cation symporter n=1 Tax=Sphingorhabdus sp. TaxID=1902408 RepID=UPI002BDA0046|nr:cation:dicarboxylase symporter family transporter [Sphingorhabdus sp.]HMT41226.1 cation:dicarboxylase symporter family transporter [Sphingorhabdus sp.]HMU22045.1 cation:dicarboxylase symporter family transporter [Sphingorhabdus sp.]
MKKAWIILAALIAGLLIGMAVGDRSPLFHDAADVVGTIWLNGLRMTVIPLVVALLITGIVQTANAASAGRTATRSVITMISILVLVTIMAAIVTPALLAIFPLDPDAAQALRQAMGAVEPAAAPPPFSEFLKAVVPTNPFQAAASDALLPLIIFTIAFAFAITRLEAGKKQILAGFFEAMAEAMVTVISWVLALAPIGVFALGVVLGMTAGAAAFGALVHYVLVVTAIGTIIMLSAYPVAMFGARFNLFDFARAAIPAQSVAISTQSSLASLPAMVQGARQLGVGARSTDIVLPMAVAIFRATSPAMNLAVAIYVAHWMGIELGPEQIVIGVAVASITTLGSVSLPGSISFIAAIAPICIAMGIPIEPLAVLVAIETFPDIMRTFGNVTMDIAVTGTIARAEGDLEKGEAA